MKVTAIICLVLATLLGFAASQQTAAQFINDNNVLNYALTLENLEAAYYAAGLAKFSDADFTTAGFAPGVRAAVAYIGSVEAQHASTLTTTLGLRGWPAVPVCTNYNFTSGLTSVTAFMNLLAVVEQVGTAAYDGAAGAITDQNILTLAAGIATVEARHSALIVAVTQINSTYPLSFSPTDSNARTQALTFDQVQAQVAGFFVGATCNSNTVNTAYGGSVTVSSSNAPSYKWKYANALRNQPQSTNVADQINFYSSLVKLTGGANAAKNDLAVLNYALTLEQLEATFYAATASYYTTTSIKGIFTGLTDAEAAIINANIAIVAAHEATHVNFLTTVISSLAQALSVPATPASACNYTTAFNTLLPAGSTFATWLSKAALLENTGVSAYVGAINLITNADAAQIAATIATVEANHAAYIANLLANSNNAAVVTGATASRIINPNITANFADTQAAFAQNVANGLNDSPITPANLLASDNAKLLLGQCNSTNYGTPSPLFLVNPKFFNDQNQQVNAPFVPPLTTTGATSGTTVVQLTISGNPSTDDVKAAIVKLLGITDPSLITVSTTAPSTKRQTGTTYYVTIKNGAASGQTSGTLANTLVQQVTSNPQALGNNITVTKATVTSGGTPTTSAQPVGGNAAVTMFSIALIAVAALF